MGGPRAQRFMARLKTLGTYGAGACCNRSMLRLAHLSDLHFGAADPDALEELKKAVAKAAPDLAIVTGDVTQSGRRREFAEASAYFKTFEAPLFILPGNHDAPVYSLPLRFIDPWKRFRNAFGAQTDAALHLPGATIVGLNSARRAAPSLDWSRGQISSAQLRLTEQEFALAPAGAARIIALHHPVIPGPGRAGAAVVGSAETALEAFAKDKVDLILTGHVHVADADAHEHYGRSMIIARAGTATSTRVRGEAPSFNMIELSEGRADIHTLSLGGDGYQSTAQRRFVPATEGWRRALQPA